METSEIDSPAANAAAGIESVPAACLPCTLSHAEECPLCGKSNRCRVARGHLYKGPCWCHEMTVPPHILSRLAADRLQPACLCRPCLETVVRVARMHDDPDVVLAETREIILTHDDSYFDENGNMVFTEAFLLKRGTCCGSGCRHCPY